MFFSYKIFCKGVRKSQKRKNKLCKSCILLVHTFFSKLKLNLYSKSSTPIKRKLSLLLNLPKTADKIYFPCKFSNVFQGPKFLCQIFLDLKPLQKSSNLYELLIYIIKSFKYIITNIIKFFHKIFGKGHQKTVNI